MIKGGFMTARIGNEPSEKYKYYHEQGENKGKSYD
tara:strand:+ start:203 stop:307 length:105 start_codon:yes stop_codon:yes gene_type:complete